MTKSLSKENSFYFLTEKLEKVEMLLVYQSKSESVKYRIAGKEWIPTSLRAFNEMASRNKWISTTKEKLKLLNL